MKVNILILNYNGRQLLEECMPSLAGACEASKNECRLCVVDNLSRDDSIEFLQKQYPQVKIFRPEENKVLCSYNEIAQQVDDDILIFLNNDIKVDKDFVDPLADIFKQDKDAFLAASKCLSFDAARYEGSKTKVLIKWGIFWASAVYPGYETEIDKQGFTFQAGFGAFDRKKFLELNGYDELYLPGRLEDSDICLRAWKRGWKCYYEPKSIVYHKGGVSFKQKFGLNKMAVIDSRNTFLFMWKNIESKLFLFEHFLFLIPRMIYALIRGRIEFVMGFFQALKRLPQALKRRRIVVKEAVRSEREIFRVLGV